MIRWVWGEITASLKPRDQSSDVKCCHGYEMSFLNDVKGQSHMQPQVAANHFSDFE